MGEMTRRGFIGAALAGSAVPRLSAAAGQGPEPAQSKVAVESNVVFGKGGDMELKLDIYRPPSRSLLLAGQRNNDRPAGRKES